MIGLNLFQGILTELQSLTWLMHLSRPILTYIEDISRPDAWGALVDIATILAASCAFFALIISLLDRWDRNRPSPLFIAGDGRNALVNYGKIALNLWLHLSEITLEAQSAHLTGDQAGHIYAPVASIKERQLTSALRPDGVWPLENITTFLKPPIESYARDAAKAHNRAGNSNDPLASIWLVYTQPLILTYFDRTQRLRYTQNFTLTGKVHAKFDYQGQWIQHVEINTLRIDEVTYSKQRRRWQLRREKMF